MKKVIVFILTAIIANSSFSQQNLVQVIASGDGKTKDEALNAALRHCIEKTFGVFVSTNTAVANDSLVKDDIASIASGNIASYTVISEIKNNEIFTTMVSAQVSPGNIVKIMKSKGYEFEIKGSVFTQNILKEEFYKKEEVKIFKDFLEKWEKISIFDFEITTDNSPKKEGSRIIDNFKFSLDRRRWRKVGYGSNNKAEYYSVSSEFQFRWLMNSDLSVDKENSQIGRDAAYDNSSYYFKGNTYSIQSVFNPIKNSLYDKFKEELVNLLKNLSIKESITDYETLYGKVYTLNFLENANSKAPPFTIISGDLPNEDINEQEFYFRNEKLENYFLLLDRYLIFNCLALSYQLKDEKNFIDKFVYIASVDYLGSKNIFPKPGDSNDTYRRLWLLNPDIINWYRDSGNYLYQPTLYFLNWYNYYDQYNFSLQLDKPVYPTIIKSFLTFEQLSNLKKVEFIRNNETKIFPLVF